MAPLRRDEDALPPRTPKPKPSSSSILQAFKNLTAGKSKALPSSPSTATSGSPPPSGNSNFSQIQHYSNTAAPKSATEPTEETDSTGDFEQVVASDGQYVGGPPVLKQQLRLLHSDNPVPVRVKAAQRIARLLKDYPISNVVGIWMTGRSLLNVDDGAEPVDAAYALLIACVRYKKLTPQERRFFFDTIPRTFNAATFAQRFKVLQEITTNGRYLECLENVLIPLLVKLLEQCFEQVLVARKSRGVKHSNSLSEEHHLSQIYDYTSEIIKFNSKMFSEQHLRMLVTLLLSVCRKTAAESDLRRAIEIMDAIMTYSYIPDSQDLYDYLQILCVVFCAIRPLKELAWKSAGNLLRSHHGPTSITALLLILKRSNNDNNLYRDATKGAVLVFHEMLSSDDNEGLPPVDTRKLISAVRKSLDADSARLETCALRLLLFLLQDDNPTNLLLNDKLWKNFSDIIVISCRRLRSENRAHALAMMPQDILTIDFHTETEKGMDAATVSSQLVQCICNRLLPLAADMDLEQKGMVMDLMMQVSHTLDDPAAKYLIEFYAEHRLQLPSAPDWRVSCNYLYGNLLIDQYRSTAIRTLTLQTLHDTYNIGEVLDAPSSSGLIVSVLECIKHERDLSIAELLAKIAGDVAIWTSDEDTFNTIVDCLCVALFSWSHEATMPSSPLISAKDMPFIRASGFSGTLHDTHGTFIAKALVRVFLRAIHTSAFKTEKIYHVLLKIAGSNEPAADARVICLKVLFRMRGDVNHGIFIVPSTDCESMAAALCRTADTMMADHPTRDSPIIKALNAEDHVARRKPPGTGAALTRTVSGNVKSTSGSGWLNRPTPPLWMYPGPKGLPEDPYRWASHLVYSHLDAERSPDLSNSPRVVLKISAWLELLLRILQSDIEWEVFSYIVVHIGAQLMNHSLFIECVAQIRMLRNVICGQLANRSFHEPPAWTNLNRSDVAVCMYHILTVIVSYHDYFTSGEEDDIVKMFIHGIGSWERTSEVCIHGLSVCCHELPVSVSRALESLLSKLSQTISQTRNVAHVLEFLAALGRLPELYTGFQEHEFRLVFDVAFKYLQTTRQTGLTHTDTTEVPKPQGTPKSRPRDHSPVVKPQQSAAEEHLPQYVFALSYHVMTFWFMSLSIEDRPKQIPWIIQNLMYTDPKGQVTMDEQALVTIDVMQRVAYSDRDDTLINDDFASVYDGKRNVQSWVVGLSILTIDTATRTGASQIIRRRPSGTRYSIFRPSITRPPRHQVPITRGQAADVFYTEDYTGILPADILQEFYAAQHLSPSTIFAESPIPLPDDEATSRTISSFDRISALDGHKVGLIYVGEAQDGEADILSNVMGSADYTHFLRHIGTLTRLKDATFNTQGLDRVNDEDGQFTFCWRDRVSEIVFHVTTMMPTNLEDDPICMNKKKHVGNDFVNIIFNNSGIGYSFGTIASAFNYVNIVITPEARASFVETRLWARDQIAKHQLEASISSLGSHLPHPENQRDLEASSHITDVSENPYAKLNYKVQVITAPGMPPISPAAETKIVSGAALPAFVRLIALNASVFCQVWVNRGSIGGSGEHVSSWRSRLREITKLREKHAQPQTYRPPTARDFSPLEISTSSLHSKSNGMPPPPPTAMSNGSVEASSPGSTRPTSDSKRESGLFRRASLANIWSTGALGGSTSTIQSNGPATTNGTMPERTSWLSNQDMERTSSMGSFL